MHLPNTTMVAAQIPDNEGPLMQVPCFKDVPTSFPADASVSEQIQPMDRPEINLNMNDVIQDTTRRVRFHPDVTPSQLSFEPDPIASLLPETSESDDPLPPFTYPLPLLPPSVPSSFSMFVPPPLPLPTTTCENTAPESMNVHAGSTAEEKLQVSSRRETAMACSLEANDVPKTRSKPTAWEPQATSKPTVKLVPPPTKDLDRPRSMRRIPTGLSVFPPRFRRDPNLPQRSSPTATRSCFGATWNEDLKDLRNRLAQHDLNKDEKDQEAFSGTDSHLASSFATDTPRLTDEETPNSEACLMLHNEDTPLLLQAKCSVPEDSAETMLLANGGLQECERPPAGVFQRNASPNSSMELPLFHEQQAEETKRIRPLVGFISILRSWGSQVLMALLVMAVLRVFF